MISVRLIYTREIVKAAVWAFWLKTVERKFLVVLVLLTGFEVYLLATGNRSWVAGMLGTTVLFGFAMTSIVYVVHFRRGMAKFSAMKDPHANLELDEERFRVRSGAGASELPWSAVKEIWQFEEFWLLLFSPAEFMTLPLENIPMEARELILRKVSGPEQAPS